MNTYFKKLKVFLALRVIKLDSCLTLVFLNLDKILNLSKNIVLLLPFSSLITLLFTLLAVLLDQFLDKNNDNFNIKVTFAKILLKP